MALTTTSDSRGPNLLAGSSHTGINNLNSTSAGGNVISPVINYNYGVHVPAIDSLVPPEAAEILRALLNFPSPNAAQTHDGLSLNTTPPGENHVQVESQGGSEPHSGGVFVTDLETLPPLPGGNTNDIPTIYVRNLLNHGHGLPCYDPKFRGPSARTAHPTVLPGDVGLYTPSRGFKKLFNIWEDQVALHQTASDSLTADQLISFHLPPQQVERHGNHIVEGTGMPGGGPASVTLYCPNTECVPILPDIPFPLSRLTEASRIINRFEVTCDGSSQGAVLALTSSGDLVEIHDYDCLREFLVDFAEVIYNHSRRHRGGAAPKDSLYVITGCVLSENCGIAAYNHAMTSPNNVLRLENRIISEHPVTPRRAWKWTSTGTSMARFHGASTNGADTQTPRVKDQTLFLQGFKLEFSSDFLASQVRLGGNRNHAPSPSGGGPSSNEPNSSGNQGSTGSADHRSGQSSSAGNRPFSGGGGDNMQDCSSVPDRGVTVQVFPEVSDEQEYHPCDVINQYVMKLTGARIALSHDDDWRILLKRCPGPEAAPSIGVASGRCRRNIYMRNGVAYLLSAGPSPKKDDTAHDPIPHAVSPGVFEASHLLFGERVQDSRQGKSSIGPEESKFEKWSIERVAAFWPPLPLAQPRGSVITTSGEPIVGEEHDGFPPHVWSTPSLQRGDGQRPPPRGISPALTGRTEILSEPGSSVPSLSRTSHHSVSTDGDSDDVPPPDNEYRSGREPKRREATGSNFKRQGLAFKYYHSDGSFVSVEDGSGLKPERSATLEEAISHGGTKASKYTRASGPGATVQRRHTGTGDSSTRGRSHCLPGPSSASSSRRSSPYSSPRVSYSPSDTLSPHMLSPNLIALSNDDNIAFGGSMLGHAARRQSRHVREEGGVDAGIRASEARTTKEAKFLCDLCGQAFTKNRHLINHRNVHLGKRYLKHFPAVYP